jgi:hypothetical protein
MRRSPEIPRTGTRRRAEIADEAFVDANQVMVFEAGSLWLPILGRDVVPRVPSPARSSGDRGSSGAA